MKVEVSDLSPIKKRFEIEVPPDEIERETQRVVRRYARQVRIPGFRPGKAPLDVVRSRFRKEIEEDVRDGLITRTYGEAAREQGLEPIADPVLEKVEHEAGGPLRFNTTFEILPRFEAKGYRGVEVPRVEDPVGEADVDKLVEEIRQGHARLVAVDDKAAETGDVVVTDVEGTPSEGEPFKRENVLLEVGATENLPAFNEGLDGVRAGDVREFPVEYPAEYHAENLAGKTVRYRLSVHEIKTREIPALDDDFAKDLGEFDDLAALKARVREDLGHRRAREADAQARRDLLDKVLLENPVPLPESLVEDEIRHRLEDMARSMILQGIDPEKVDLDWKQLRDRHEEQARKSVHARLVLDAVARQEGIEVSREEVDARIRQEAERIGEPEGRVRGRLAKSGGLEAIKNQLLREKSLDFMTSVANIRNRE